jgi:hypothetical protein
MNFDDKLKRKTPEQLASLIDNWLDRASELPSVPESKPTLQLIRKSVVRAEQIRQEKLMGQ